MKNFLLWDNPTHEDVELIEKFFEPLCHCIVLPESTSMETLMIEAGVFSSKGDSRKNGFFGSVPPGLHILGTKKKKFWCWKKVI